MKRRLPASTTTRKKIEELMSGQGEVAGSRSELVKLAAQLIIEEALEGEVNEELGREYYAHGSDGRGQRNGYRQGKLKTAEGRIEYAVPQVRGLDGWKSAVRDALSGRTEELERLAIEMWARGLSVRDIEAAFVDEGGRCVLSKSAVSAVTERLWSDYQAFVSRDLSNQAIVYLFVDGVAERLHLGQSREAVLVGWGLMRAVEEVLPRSLRQRCLAHRLRNLQGKVPAEQWREVKAVAWATYTAPSPTVARLARDEFVKRYERELPTATQCFLDDFEACISHLRLPISHRRAIRTTSLLERLFGEERRRTKVIPHAFGERPVLKLMYSALIRASQSWQRVAINDFELKQIDELRCELDDDFSQRTATAVLPASRQRIYSKEKD